eukprot:1789368-Prymnesium_polylepis.2
MWLPGDACPRGRRASSTRQTLRLCMDSLCLQRMLTRPAHLGNARFEWRHWTRASSPRGVVESPE